MSSNAANLFCVLITLFFSVDRQCRGPKGADGSPGADEPNNSFRTFSRRNKDSGQKEVVSYVDYFRSISIEIKEPDLPLLKCRAVNGKVASVCHLPPELLQEAGWNKGLFANNAKEMLEVCSLEPEERQKDTLKVVRLIASEGDVSAQQSPTAKLLADFGLSISQKPADMKALVLPTPKCTVMNKQGTAQIQSDFGGGSPLGNGRNNVLEPGRPIKCVVILAPDREQRRAEDFYRVWCDVAGGFGTQFPSRNRVFGCV